MIRCSIIIPTRNRTESLLCCLDHLARQTISHDQFEILVGFDGPDETSDAACRSHVLGGNAIRAMTCERLGIAHVKNELISHATGQYIVLLNDDVMPAPDFLARHLAAHERLSGRAAMIVGHSPWVIPEDANQFDLLIARTSMIFFYDRMLETAANDPDRDWGFRHAWNLNLSIPRSAVCAAGGFCPAIANCCYEDIEFAYRLGLGGLPVIFEPNAFAPHDHRYTPAGYLDREFRLGFSAFGFAHAAPECAREIFGRDVLASHEVGYARDFVAHESAREHEMLATFQSLTDRSHDAWPGNEWIALAYQQHLTLKRLAFRRGFLHAMDGGAIENMFHPRDALPVIPPLREVERQRSA